MIHALITALFCGLIWLLKLDTFLMFLPAALYVGREFAQAEERYIQQYCNKKRSNMPWWAPFTLKAWTGKGFFDFILPCCVSFIIFLLNWYIHK